MSRHLVLAASLLVPAMGTAQQPLRAGAGVSFEQIAFGSSADVGLESVTLLTIPLRTQLRLHRAIAIEAAASWASAQLNRPDGSTSTLTGPTDTELRLVLNLGNGLATITGVAQLPTGTASLSAGQADVAGFMAADLLPFRISNWGTGGGAGVNVALARTTGDFAAGISVGYVMAREFEPLADNTFSYRPGNQLLVRAALDRTVGSSGKLALVFSLQHFTDDEVNDVNLFRPGVRYDGTASYAFALGGSSAGIVYAGYLRRAGGNYLQAGRVLPVQELLFAGTGFELPAGAATFRPKADVRVLRRADGTGQGFTTSLGADLDIPIRTITLVPSVQGRIGSLVIREGAESGFTGFEAAFTIRFGPRW
jgi:hypothetical protein